MSAPLLNLGSQKPVIWRIFAILCGKLQPCGFRNEGCQYKYTTTVPFFSTWRVYNYVWWWWWRGALLTFESRPSSPNLYKSTVILLGVVNFLFHVV